MKPSELVSLVLGHINPHMFFLVTNDCTFTEHDLVVHSIEVNDFNAQQQCKFKGDDGVLIETSLKIDYESGEQKLVLEEPQTVRSFSCEGICIGINGMSTSLRHLVLVRYLRPPNVIS